MRLFLHEHPLLDVRKSGFEMNDVSQCICVANRQDLLIVN